MNHCTQKEALLAYVREHHFITRRDAAIKLSVMNLWARVADLESDGFKFDRRRTTTKGGKRVMQYWLKGQAARAAA